MGFCKLWEFYHSCPSARNKQSIHIVSFPAGHTTVSSQFFFSQKEHGLHLGFGFIIPIHYYKNNYTTAKKKRPNQLGYLVGIWL